MDELLQPLYQTILNWQFLLFALGISAIIFVLRKVVEYTLKQWKENTVKAPLWRDLILPTSPVVLGCLLALVLESYPYPETLNFTGGRFIFGLAAGLLSGLIFRLITAFLKEKLSVLLSNMASKIVKKPPNNPEE